MHELSVVAGLFDILEEKAREAGAARVTAVTIRVGRLSGVVPDLLESAFDAFKKGTIASEAALVIEVARAPRPVPLVRKRDRRRRPDSSPVPPAARRGCEILEGMDIFLQKLEIETLTGGLGGFLSRSSGRPGIPARTRFRRP